uniref:Secreted protein n=1 Tax=Anguilla anguilla TaxID=7936 RepID=A0A0E9WWF4_ANGAN
MLVRLSYVRIVLLFKVWSQPHRPESRKINQPCVCFTVCVQQPKRLFYFLQSFYKPDFTVCHAVGLQPHPYSLYRTRPAKMADPKI